MEKELHIYMYDPKDIKYLPSYNSVLRAIKNNKQIIHTTQTHFCSNRAIYDYDYVIYIHTEGSRVIRIDKSGSDATNRQLKQGHNLEKMLLAGEFGIVWCEDGAW